MTRHCRLTAEHHSIPHAPIDVRRPLSKRAAWLMAASLSLVYSGAVKASVHAAVPSTATAAGKRFMAECERDHVNPALTYRMAVASPAEASGHELALTASVNGFVQIGDQTTYMLGLQDGSQASVATRSEPDFASGASVSALVRIPDNWDGTQALTLVDMVSAFDAESATPPKKPAHAFNRSGTRSTYARSMETSRSFDSAGLDSRRRLQSQYARAVQYFNPRLSDSAAEVIAGHVIWYSQINNVDARLIMAVIAVESDFDNSARSNKGAMGLGQLMPGTARDLGCHNPYDPEQNIAAAVRLIHWHLTQNTGKDDPLALALACYNAGENAVKHYHGVPPYRETVRYVRKVKQLYEAMCRGGN